MVSFFSCKLRHRYLQQAIDQLPSERLWIQIAEDLDDVKEELAVWLGIDAQDNTRAPLPHKIKKKQVKTSPKNMSRGINPSVHSGLKLKVSVAHGIEMLLLLTAPNIVVCAPVYICLTHSICVHMFLLASKLCMARTAEICRTSK